MQIINSIISVIPKIVVTIEVWRRLTVLVFQNEWWLLVWEEFAVFSRSLMTIECHTDAFHHAFGVWFVALVETLAGVVELCPGIKRLTQLISRVLDWVLWVLWQHLLESQLILVRIWGFVWMTSVVVGEGSILCQYLNVLSICWTLRISSSRHSVHVMPVVVWQLTNSCFHWWTSLRFFHLLISRLNELLDVFGELFEPLNEVLGLVRLGNWCRIKLLKDRMRNVREAVLSSFDVALVLVWKVVFSCENVATTRWESRTAEC